MYEKAYSENVTNKKVFETIKPLFIEAVTTMSLVRSGGITSFGEFVKSDYFSRLKKLGDFDSATRVSNAYHKPYLDFAISEVYGKYHFIIGMMSL